MEPEKKDDDDNDNCPICLDTLSSGGIGKTLLKTRCEHAFHRKCLLEWLKNGRPGNCCPLCKRACSVKETVPVAFGKHYRPTRRSNRIRSCQEAARAKVIAEQETAVNMFLAQQRPIIVSLISGLVVQVNETEEMMREMQEYQQNVRHHLTSLEQQLIELRQRMASVESPVASMDLQMRIDGTVRSIANNQRQSSHIDQLLISLTRLRQSYLRVAEI